MFKLTRAKYITALASAETMETVLTEENERLRKSHVVLQDNWQGMQSEKTLGMIKESQEGGSHAKALAYVRGMTTVMSEYLPEIEKLMAKREQIGEQLKQDAYKAPDLSRFQEEELIIDYSYIDNVKADADGALHYGDAAIRILREMMAEAEQCAGEYLDFSEAEELLEEGEKKLHRLENYRDEFVDLGKKMSDMEYNMSSDFSRIMTEQGDLQTALHVMGSTYTDQKTRTEQMLGTEEELLLQPGKENAIIDAGVDILKMTAENGDLYTADGVLLKHVSMGGIAAIVNTNYGKEYYIEQYEKALELGANDYCEQNSEVKNKISESGICIIEVPNRAEQVAFLESILEGAVKEDIYSGVPWQVTMAQAALETGWGKTEMVDIYTGVKSNNLFGIKYFGSPQESEDYVRVWTSEVIKSDDLKSWEEEHAKWAKEGEALKIVSQKGGEIEIKVIQPFKVFDSPSESIVAHSKVLENDYYEDAKKYKDNAYLYAEKIAPSYATDPQYADKLIQIIDKYMQWNNKELDRESSN